MVYVRRKTKLGVMGDNVLWVGRSETNDFPKPKVGSFVTTPMSPVVGNGRVSTNIFSVGQGKTFIDEGKSRRGLKKVGALFPSWEKRKGHVSDCKSYHNPLLMSHTRSSRS